MGTRDLLKRAQASVRLLQTSVDMMAALANPEENLTGEEVELLESVVAYTTEFHSGFVGTLQPHQRTKRTLTESS